MCLMDFSTLLDITVNFLRSRNSPYYDGFREEKSLPLIGKMLKEHSPKSGN